MSRGGGRGGGRGGRGGRRGGGPQLPWEEHETDTRPSELFPPYKVPRSHPPASHDQRAVNAFLLIRHQIHDSPLHTARKLTAAPTAPYTHPSTTSSATGAGQPAPGTSTPGAGGGAPGGFAPVQKHYGQAQLNAKYAASSGALHSRATVDPFTAVPTYSQRFARKERTLPDFSSRPYCPEFVPKELHATFEGDDGPGAGAKGKRKRITLSKVKALPTAEDVFGIGGAGGAERDVDGDWAEDEDFGDEEGRGSKKRTLEALERIGADEDGAAGAGAEGAEGEEELDEEEVEEEEQDEEYDDEDAGDYDAEGYFEDGDDMGEDMDDDGGRDEY